MSEQKKASEIIMETLAGIQKQLDELKQKPSSTTSTPEPKPHVHTKADVFDCPECGAAYLAEARKRLEPVLVKEQKDKLKGLKEPVICVDCGEVVEKEEPECPTCHGRKARKIE